VALVTDLPRSAGVRAARDCELLRVDAADFSDMLERRPDFARALTRVLGSQLRDVRATGIEKSPLPATIALVPLGPGLPVADLGGYLALQLGLWRPVIRLDGGEGDFGPMLDHAERSHEQVVMVAHDPDPADPWTAFCLRQADRVLGVTRSREDAPYPHLRGCDLLMLDAADRDGLRRLIAALEPRFVHVARAGGGSAAAIERMARRLAGRSLGLVLSGGGARAFAHIGIIEAIENSGIHVDRVGGTSGGAFVGSLFAAGRSAAEILDFSHREFIEDNPLNDYTLPLVSITRNRKGLRMLERAHGDARFEELEREFFCVSCDMQTAEQVIHRRGPVAPAVAASMTLPGMLPPLPLDGRMLLDGGVLNNLPVDVMAAAGEGPIIAVDVSAHFELPDERASRFRRPRLARLASRAREWIVGSSLPLPSLGETITRSIVLGSVDTGEAAQRFADIAVIPDVADCGLLDWNRMDDLVEAGRRAMEAELAKAPAGLLG
jgi:predicted acylesterase/phospholipase RssA